MLLIRARNRAEYRLLVSPTGMVSSCYITHYLEEDWCKTFRMWFAAVSSVGEYKRWWHLQCTHPNILPDGNFKFLLHNVYYITSISMDLTQKTLLLHKCRMNMAMAIHFMNKTSDADSHNVRETAAESHSRPGFERHKFYSPRLFCIEPGLFCGINMVNQFH